MDYQTTYTWFARNYYLAGWRCVAGYLGIGVVVGVLALLVVPLLLVILAGLSLPALAVILVTVFG